MYKNIRVRFAPSPTGYLHIGNARTALFNWLFAQKYRGVFILRIEDTDQERINPQFEKAIIEDLHWLGLHWNEGPLKGGDFGPYRQSERHQLYYDIAQKLIQEGKAYHCYCTPEELEKQRQELLQVKKPPRYQGTCRKLSAKQKQAFEKEGRKPSVRFMVEDSGSVIVEDLVRGAVTVEKDVLGDFIILRSNGIAAYNLAVVIDDNLMRITHVLRGEDHLSNTPRQQLLYEALGHPLPHFAHLPMILGPDRTMLSKRHGATSVAQFRQEGYLPQALNNYLALLGWSPGDGRELLSVEEIIEAFSLARLNKSAAVFDIQKLNWANEHYLRGEEIGNLTDLCLPYLQKAGYYSEPPEGKELAWLHAVINSARPNITTLNQIADYTRVYFKKELSVEADARQYLIDGEPAIKQLIEELTKLERAHLTEQNYNDIIRNIQKSTGLKGKKLFMPIRVALTGKTKGPELKHLFTLLGKGNCMQRTRKTLKNIHQTAGSISEGNDNIDRRKTPRKPVYLPIKLVTEDGTVVSTGRALNISCYGIKLGLKLEITFKTIGNKSSTDEILSGKSLTLEIGSANSSLHIKTPAEVKWNTSSYGEGENIYEAGLDLKLTDKQKEEWEQFYHNL